MNSEVTFQEVAFSPRGETLELSGELAGRPGRRAEGIVLCHPHPQFGGDMRYPLVEVLAGELAGSGYTTLRFNFRGVGRSGGRYDGGNGEVLDVLGAVDYLRSQEAFPVEAVDVIGYSFGAWVGLRAAADGKMRKAVGLCLPAGLFDFGFLRDLKIPLLAVHGTQDQFTSEGTVRDLVRESSAPSRIEIITDGDHFMAGREKEIFLLVKDFLEEERE